MFENYEQEEEPQNKRLALTITLCLLLLPPGFFLAFQFLPGMREDPPQLHHTVQFNDPARLQRVVELCTSLPVPEQFFLDLAGEPQYYSVATAVSYRYKSDRALEEIMPFFTIWFNENGWKPAPGGGYRKGKQTISVYAYGRSHTLEGYITTCTEYK